MKLWILAVLLLLVFVLVAQNAETVTVRLLFWQVTLSRVVLLALTFAAGVLTGFIAAKLRGGGRHA